MALTDAQLKVLLTDYRTARTAADKAAADLDAATQALARALGPGSSVVVQGRQIEANADATDVTVTPTRVVV